MEKCPTCGGPLDKKGRCEMCDGLDEITGADHLGGTIEEICDNEDGTGQAAYGDDLI